jgi:hypothetical protein
MHTFKHNNVTFTFNPDLSGEVSIGNGQVSLDIPGEALQAFLCEWARHRAIALLEQFTHNQIGPMLADAVSLADATKRRLGVPQQDHSKGVLPAPAEGVPYKAWNSKYDGTDDPGCIVECAGCFYLIHPDAYVSNDTDNFMLPVPNQWPIPPEALKEVARRVSFLDKQKKRKRK